MVCARLLVVSDYFLVVCGCLLVICGRLLEVCGRLLVVCDRLCSFVMICGRLWPLSVLVITNWL